jgi:hypothetical protein
MGADAGVGAYRVAVVTGTLLVAMYGALLSTGLAVARLFASWPVVALAPGARLDVDQSAVLQVTNPAKRPLFIRDLTQWPRDKPGFRVFERPPESLNAKRDEMALNYQQTQYEVGPLRVFVPPGGTVSLVVHGIDPGMERLIVLWWTRGGLIRWLWPTVPVRISVEFAAMANQKRPP